MTQHGDYVAHEHTSERLYTTEELEEFSQRQAEAARHGAAVDPLTDFGGWGIRWVVGPNHRGRWGVITRRGPGLEVVRRDGRSIVITVDDASTGAAVLQTYARRQG